MTAALQADGVAAGYGERRVLDGVTLALREGGMLALLGPNGAGKSTLLRAVTGLCPLRGGRVRIFDRDLTQLRPRERARLVAVVPQELDTPMAFTVEALVAMGRGVSHARWGALTTADRHAIERALAYTDALDLRERLYNELSGGERQRAAIAMALAQGPRLLLLDEPTSHLDINHRLEILQLLERLSREDGMSVIMTSHDLNLAAEFFPELALLHRGRVAAHGSAADVLRPALLEEVYHCPFRVDRDAGGSWVVAPERAHPAAPSDGRERRAHVICGGGSGGEILRRLRLAGWTLTCGALNEGDSDMRAADALGLRTALERPFAPLGDACLREAADWAGAADAVVVCEVPFGPGNVRNLDVARAARDRGIPVYLCTRNLEGRDYTGTGGALTLSRQLIEAGAQPWLHVGDLLRQMDA